MKHLKLFETLAQYESFKSSSDFVLPNVSHIKEFTGLPFNDPKRSVMYTPKSDSSSNYVMVDLGLPSGLLWADRNIGASSPEDNGLYFAWGDTVGYTAEQVTNGEKKFASDWSDYFDTTNGGSTFDKYDTYKLTILQPEDDAAAVNMGSEYKMPTQANFNELINNCTVTFIDLNGNEFSKSETESGSISAYKLKGVKFTGSNGNSIFIPAAGMCGDSSFGNDHFNGYLWSSLLRSGNSTYALYLTFDFSGYINVRNTINRYTGHPIRGVKAK